MDFIPLSGELNGIIIMKIAVTGASGLLGRELFPHLIKAGYTPIPIVRTRDQSGEAIYWNPELEEIEAEKLEGVHAVIHLAGEPVAGSLWSPAQKERIRSSRVQGTGLLSKTLASLDKKPGTLLCASAIGFYGDQGAAELTEESPPGKGFLPEVCQEWEQSANPAREAGIRVVHLRIGVVLSRYGGALKKMIPPFKWGAGGILGNGEQYWSWVALEDVLGAINHLLRHEELSGPFNCTAPQPATNREFTKALGAALNRPTCLPVPAFAVRTLFGEMGKEVLLASSKVLPKRLEESGYQFQHTEIEAAIRHELQGPKNG